MKRHEYLIISAVCLIGFILTLAAIARAGEREQDTIFTVGVGWEF